MQSLKNIVKKKINKINAIFNINYDITKKQKRVAISYVHYSMIQSLSSEINHPQLLEVNQIIKEFINRDYCIDLFNCKELLALEKIKQTQYDVVFGLSDVFYELGKLNKNARKIIYVTENRPKFSYSQEKERIQYYFERKHKKLPIVRSGEYFKEEHFKELDIEAAIVMGEIKYFNDLPYKVLPLEPTGIINEKFTPAPKDYKKSKKNFLWLGSLGAVHKGLDILIDVFSKRDDVVLHICGLRGYDKKYIKIPKRPNIIDYGVINIKTDLFLKLAETCSYIILPSCSEALSTSVLTGMLHSLVPVVIKDTGFNRLGDNAIFLEDYKVEYIDKVITNLSMVTEDEILVKETQTFEYARNEFTIERFTEKFRSICDVLQL